MHVYSSYMGGVSLSCNSDSGWWPTGPWGMSISCHDSPHVDDKVAATYSVYSARPRCLRHPLALPLHVWACVFHIFICCYCHDSGAGRIATTFFGTRRAAELHISRSSSWVACVKLLARVSGMSQWSTETPSWPRTKRLDWLERLDTVDSHCGLCCRRGAAAWKVTYLPQYLKSLLSDVRNDVVTLGLRYPYILILSPISALISATTSGTSLIS